MSYNVSKLTSDAIPNYSTLSVRNRSENEYLWQISPVQQQGPGELLVTPGHGVKAWVLLPSLNSHVEPAAIAGMKKCNTLRQCIDLDAQCHENREEMVVRCTKEGGSV